MPIKTYSPQARIWLQTYNNKMEELTPYVRSLSVARSIEPPWECWNLSLLPAKDKDGRSWYERISPNDYISIRFARYPENLDENMRFQMRGLVDAVNIQDSVDIKGAPNRSYNVIGSGLVSKLLNITKIYYLTWNCLESLLKDWGLSTFYHVPLDGSPQQLMAALFKIVIGTEGKTPWEYLRNTYANLPEIKLISADNIEGFTNTLSIGQQAGPIAGILRSIQNYPWNELYPTEFEDSPALIFRSTPWKDENGIYIQDIDTSKTPYRQTLGEPIDITPSDIIARDLNRNDAEVRNVFFTYPYHSIIDTNSWRAIAVNNQPDGKGNPYLVESDDTVAGKNRFGFRYHEMTIPYGEVRNPKDQTQNNAGIKWLQKINQQFARASYQNANYESGQLTLKGNENIAPGRYIKFGDAEYYVTSARHDLNFVDRGRYTTTVEVVRGTGFLELQKRRQPQ